MDFFSGISWVGNRLENLRTIHWKPEIDEEFTWRLQNRNSTADPTDWFRLGLGSAVLGIPTKKQQVKRDHMRVMVGICLLYCWSSVYLQLYCPCALGDFLQNMVISYFYLYHFVFNNNNYNDIINNNSNSSRWHDSHLAPFMLIPVAL